MDFDGGGDVAVLDAAIVDAETTNDADARDASTDVTPDASDGDGAAAIVERVPPWRNGACIEWTRMPMSVAYAAPLYNAEGIWAVGGGMGDGEIASGLYHRASSTWALVTGVSVSGTSLIGGTNWVLSGQSYRRDGRWTSIEPRGTALCASGDDIFFFQPDGRAARFDGTTWTAMPSAPGPVENCAGSRTGLLAFRGLGFAGGPYYFDGVSWSALTLPTGSAIISADETTPGGELYAVSRDAYLRIESGGRLVTVPFGDCTGSSVSTRPTLNAVFGGGGQLVVQAACGTSMPAGYWRRTGTGWTALPTFPPDALRSADPDVYSSPSPFFRVSPTGDISIGGESGVMYRLGSTGTWVPLPIDTPAPPALGLAGRNATELYAVGAGVARMVGDAWVPVPGGEMLDALSAWVAPDDGTLFVGTRVPGGGELWRYAGGRWTRDAVLTGWPTVITGRNTAEAYAAVDYQLYRWDGVAWRALAVPPICERLASYGQLVGRLGLVGARTLVAQCWLFSLSGLTDHLYTLNREFDGTVWSDVTSVGDMGALSGAMTEFCPFGSASSPGVVIPKPAYRQWHQRTEAGWLSRPMPSGDRSNAMVSVSPTSFVARMIEGSGMFGRGDGVAPWRVSTPGTVQFTRWPVESMMWSDGRLVVWTNRPSEGGGARFAWLAGTIARCDLGP